MNTTSRRVRLLAGSAALLSLVVVGCSRAGGSDPASTATNQGAAGELRLGYFPNVTHASALIGLDKGLFAKELGNTKLTPTKFNDGPTETSALLGGSVDAGFIGSGPAINAFTKSNGDVKIIAGATSGGAQFVVAPGIDSPADLRGKKIADPQQGNTQDVSLKKWLSQQHLTSDVTVQNLDNAVTLDEFKAGRISGAWLPEPWSARLVVEGGAKVLVDESTLWPGGRFPTTVLVVRTQYLAEHPDTVKALLRGELDAIDYEAGDKAGAEAAVNNQLKTLTGKALSQQVIDRSFSAITLTTDPLAARFPQLAQDQVVAGIAKQAPKVQGLVDLDALNEVLTAAGKAAADTAGLGSK